MQIKRDVEWKIGTFGVMAFKWNNVEKINFPQKPNNVTFVLSYNSTV